MGTPYNYIHKVFVVNTNSKYCLIVSKVSSSSEINAPVTVYNIYMCIRIYPYLYILYVWPFGPAGGAKCKMASTCKHTGSLKFKGQVRK